MKVKDLKGIFSNYTSVKLVVYGDIDVWAGYWYNVPYEFENYLVDWVIPIKHPDNDKLGMACILIREDY